MRLAKSSSDDRLPAYLCCKLLVRERCFVQTRQRKLVHGRGLDLIFWESGLFGPVPTSVGAGFFLTVAMQNCFTTAVPGGPAESRREFRGGYFVRATNFELDHVRQGHSNPNRRGY